MNKVLPRKSRAVFYPELQLKRALEPKEKGWGMTGIIGYRNDIDSKNVKDRGGERTNHRPGSVV